MKHFFYHILAVGILFVGFTQGLQASHIMGVDITYECIGPCTYRIYFKEYFDCEGSFMTSYIPVSTSAAPNPPSLGGSFTLTGLGACNAPTPLTPTFNFVSYQEVTPICPSLLNNPSGVHPTGCEGANPNSFVNGVVEASYYVDYNFCSTNCNQYLITFSDCCRNNIIDSGAAGNGIYTGQTIIDLSVSPCNSSPSFINEPVPYICGGQPFTFNQGATDPDGDSLVYELGPCFSGSGTPVGYDAGYSPTQPLGPTWDVSINSQTGDITMIPNPTGSEVVVVMCVTVKEYRNGVLIGQVTRDMQITVISQCASVNPVTQGITNVVIGTDSVPADALSFNEVRTCAAVPICFDIPVLSQDTALDYTISWNQGIPGATFADATDPTVVNTITADEPTAQFCWTPPPTAEGAYFFVVTVSDDACPIPAFTQYTIIIYVQETLINSYSQGVPIGCNEVELSVVPISSIPSPYNNIFPVTTWDGNGNLNINPGINDSSLTHLYPAPATYFYNMYLQDTFGCSINLPGLVDLNTGVVANAGADVTICANNTYLLGTPQLPGLTYTWSPSDALNDSTLAQPTFTFNGDSTQTVFDYVLEVTDGICTTYDYTTVIVNPSLETTVTVSDSVICIGDPTTLTAVGNLSAGYTYLWSTGDTTPTITVTPGSSTTYSVLTFNNGCSSDPAFATISVQSGPTAQVSGIVELCPGEATTLTATGGVSYVWQPGGFMGSNITLPNINTITSVSVVAVDNEGCTGPPTEVTLTPFPAPAPLFAANTVCEGINTTFQDLSSVSSGLIVAYEWDFGDSSPTISGQTPDHTYIVPGNYDVQLTTTTDQGCIDSVTQSITVEATPTADFTFTDECEGVPNTFTDASSIEPGNTIVNYVWDFGDSSPEAFGTTPTHVYDTFGYYNVSLTVTSAAGCTDEQVRTVLVHPIPVAEFEVISACEDSVVLATSASVIAGSLDFINSYEWDFGDDPSSPTNTSTLLNPTHIYPVATDYLITHAVTTVNGCTDQTQRVITVYPSPEADFTYDQTCQNEFTRFTDMSSSVAATPVNGWYWHLGSPDITYTTQNAQYSYDRLGPGTYRVTHGVVTTEGCVDTTYKDVVINPKPQVGFLAPGVCLFDSTQFENVSAIVSGDIVNYQYDFGDGFQAFLSDPAHVYREPGTYQVQLTATSDSGCVEFKRIETEVAAPPEISLIEEDSTCFGEEASLLVVADPDVEISWYYNLDDETEVPFQTGYTYVTPPLPYSTTYYVQATQLTGYKCTNTIRQPVTATVYEDENLELLVNREVAELPLAVFEFETASSVELESWSWTFGDERISTVPTPVHEYEYPGKYEINLKTVDVNGCVRNLSTVVEVKLITGVSLPTAFSPNGDGVNDEFSIGKYNVRDFQIKIFNRWGQKIYESNNPDFEWDGITLDGSPVREGVYVYVVQATDFNGNDINESSSLTVIK